ncbi:S8 family serine peptidase [Microbacterium sp. 4R-513]|uniref:S8 family peptidase n=1 Tax=Microbacterium sp. 4R-513 TaxID=2567934 RepID=UPI0013E1CF0B|nr:S8 family serine peptidase [Microbacterium sp. 4R-513]QIG38416.1 S8 family serine peptidase [Microbacterium sp. 4R-513]
MTVQTLADGKDAVDVEPAVPGTGFRTLRTKDDLYVMPEGVDRYVAAGVVDRDLFNVTRLIDFGYDDAHVDATPVIVELESGPTTFAADPPVPGIELGLPLESIGGAAAKADHADAAATWAALTHAEGPTAFGSDVSLAGGVEAIHLDGKVQATLDSSVPWIGAPEAWEKGYTGEGVTVAVLDTGYDDTHPDLAGRVLPESTSFVPDEDVAWDPNGHGTHVASTIAGTGAASGGSHRGVADGADLLVGKILDSSGQGQDSWVIAGMEWAASHAPIVSMSIGSQMPSDGTDMMSTALNEIAEKTGTLFVVAAGNSGAPETVNAPGAAAEALTVSSVDDPGGELSGFSSQGPLWGTGVMKPNIAGPGNNVTAARSADSPGEGDYIAMSGTSMATPHVSGAAAIIKQQHPEYTADQLRAALLSSAKDLGLTAYQQGAGVVDIAAALDAQVVASGSGDFGLVSWGEDLSPIERTVEYTNHSDAEVTVDLAATLRDSTNGGSGDDTAAALALGADSLTIPAGETRSVKIAANPADVEPGTQNTGALTASIDGTAVARTPLGLLREGERYDLTLTATGFHGEPLDLVATVVNLDEGWFDPVYVSGERTLRLPKGRWAVVAYPDIAREPDTLATVALGDPDILLDGAKTVELDARQAVPVTVDVDRDGLEQTVRRMDVNIDGIGTGVLVPIMADEMWAQPMDPSDAVAVDFTTRWRLTHERMSIDIGGRHLDALPLNSSKPMTGELKTQVVDAGAGSPEEFASAGARDRIAFVTLSPDVTPMQQAANAAAAGAAMLIMANDADEEFNTFVGGEDEYTKGPIAVAGISGVEGDLVRAMLAKKKEKATVVAEAYSDEIWDLSHFVDGSVPADLAYHPKDLARVDTTIFGKKGAEVAEIRWDVNPAGRMGYALHMSTQRGMVRTDWTDASADWDQELVTVDGLWLMRDITRSYEPGERTETAYFSPIVRPFVGQSFRAPVRAGTALSIIVPAYSDGGELFHEGTISTDAEDSNAAITTELFVDETLVRSSPFIDANYWEMPDGTHDVRVTQTATHDGTVLTSSTKLASSWTFKTTGDSEDWTMQFLPMLQAYYDVDLNAAGLAGDGRKKGETVPLALEIGHIAGAVGSGAVKTTKLEMRVAGGGWTAVPLGLVSRDTSGPGEPPTDGSESATGRAFVAAYKAGLKVPDAGGWIDLRVTTADEAGNTMSQEIEHAVEVAPAKGGKPRP